MSEKLYMINILETGNENNYTGKMKYKSAVIMLYPRRDRYYDRISKDKEKSKKYIFKNRS